MSIGDALLAAMSGTERCDINGVQIDVGRAAAARIKRVIYPPGFRWSTHIKPVTGTDTCMHGHVGFLARGRVHIEYPDGCTLDFTAPAVVEIEPEHDGWVVGDDAAVLIEFDFERETIAKLGMPAAHRHGV